MTATDDAVRTIRTNVEVLLRAIGSEDPAAHARPAAEEWSAVEVLAHVAEFMPFWTSQAVAVAKREQDGEPFGRTRDDPGRLAPIAEHGKDNVATATKRVRDALEQAVSNLREIDPARWERTGKTPQGELETVRQIIRTRVIAHLEEHANQAEAAVRGA